MVLAGESGEADHHAEGIVGAVAGGGARFGVDLAGNGGDGQLGVGIGFIEGGQPVHGSGNVAGVGVALAVDEVGLVVFRAGQVVFGIGDPGV